jgi:hypothetical protein
MGKAIRASVLVLLLACSAQAGWIQNGSPEPPPSQPTSTVQEPTTAVQEPTTGGETTNDTTDTLTQIALDLLAGLSSLL